MKVSFDFHGVLDKYLDIYPKLTARHIDFGDEVYIITGHRDTVEFRQNLIKLDVYWTKVYSITDYNQEKGVKVKYDKNGNPWLDPKIWDSTKARICQELDVDLHYDDSKIYEK